MLATRSGNEEKLTTASHAKRSMRCGVYFVSPASRGLRCPADVSVVGFNDMRFADRFNPPLTTIRLPHYEIGAAAAELLLERLGDAAAEPRQIMLEPALVVRASTAPPPARRSR